MNFQYTSQTIGMDVTFINSYDEVENCDIYHVAKLNNEYMLVHFQSGDGKPCFIEFDRTSTRINDEFYDIECFFDNCEFVNELSIYDNERIL
jgi:hypothetical protein